MADALSRTPEFYQASALTIQPQDQITLEDAIKLDLDYKQRAKDIARSCTSPSSLWYGFAVKNGVIYRPEGTIEVPNNTQFKTALLAANHDHMMSGHFGRDRTVDSLKRKWYWRGMAKEAEQYIQSCDRCQRIKSSGRSSLPAVQPIVANRPWAIITLDFVGSFMPASHTGHTECLIIVDKFTKMVHLAGCCKEVNSKDTAYLVIKYVVALHGVPEEIISDRGPQFDSQVWYDIWNILGARVKLAAPQHPQTDGQSERGIRTFLQLMRAYTESQREQWELFLPIFEFAMNNAVNTSTGITPFFANFGRHPRAADSLLGGESLHEKGETVVGRDLRRRLERIWEAIKDKLKKVADQMITRTLPSRNPLEYAIGDRVYLSKKRGHRQLSKHEALYSGPYVVKKRLGKSTYILGGTPAAVPALQNIQYLRPYRASPEQFEDREQRVADTPVGELGEEWEVEQIIDHRGEGRTRRYLIKWKDSEEHTWLPLKNLQNCQELLQEYQVKRGLQGARDQAQSEEVLSQGKLLENPNDEFNNGKPDSSLLENYYKNLDHKTKFADQTSQNRESSEDRDPLEPCDRPKVFDWDAAE